MSSENEVLRKAVAELREELRVAQKQPARKLDEVMLAFKHVENDVNAMRQGRAADKKLAEVHDTLQKIHASLNGLAKFLGSRTSQEIENFDKMFLSKESLALMGGVRAFNFPDGEDSSDDEYYYQDDSDDGSYSGSDEDDGGSQEEQSGNKTPSDDDDDEDRTSGEEEEQSDDDNTSEDATSDTGSDDDDLTVF